MAELTHFDAEGASRMVDVTGKPDTQRQARAEGYLRLQPETMTLIQDRQIQKGDVLEVARIAGIMAAKQTWSLIPLCHPLALSSVTIRFEACSPTQLRIEAEVKTRGPTGVEMEALAAVSVAALTVYDMCKAVDRSMTVETIRLLEKAGGRSGHFVRSD